MGRGVNPEGATGMMHARYEVAARVRLENIAGYCRVIGGFPRIRAVTNSVLMGGWGRRAFSIQLHGAWAVIG